MQFQISPPPAVRPGAKISIPIIVSIRPNAPRPLTPIEQLVVFASLRNESGDRPAQGLAGNMSDGLHSLEHSATRGYSKFDGLSIQEPGRYRIRIYLGVATDNEIMTKQYIDSDVVHVHPQAGAVQKACKQPSGYISLHVWWRPFFFFLFSVPY
jgi:hypothetical protein